MPNAGPYDVGASIGKGRSGTVYASTHPSTGEELAIKRIPCARLDDERIQREVGNQQRVDHEFVVKIQEVIEHAGDVFIVMERAARGDLAAHVAKHRRMPEREAKRLFQQIMLGVQHCHDRGVAHRDLKLENIFLDAERRVKIGDFGLSAEMREGELLKGPVGSPHFAAPELFDPEAEYEGPPIDAWSCGVVLYAMLCGTLPFHDRHLPRLFSSIRRGEYAMPRYVSAHAKDLIAQLLVVDPAKRIPTAHILEHDWFKEDVPVGTSAPASCGDAMACLAFLPLFGS